MPLEDAKQISIVDFLSKRNIPHHDKTGNKIMFKSPFGRDTNFSLCVYTNTNSFYDWSQGFGGSIIDLVMAMEGCSISEAITYLDTSEFQEYQRNYKESKPRVQKQFEYTRYLTVNKVEIAAIKEYAASRGITNGYELGVFPILIDDEWVRNPSIMYLHRDEQSSICGAKFRRIDTITPSDKGNSPRFSARGRMAFYILENISEKNYGPPTLYVVEGEGNANSLWEYLKGIGSNCVVISFGGVANLPTALPEKYLGIEDKRLIIDFDGDEALYQKRLHLYEPYGLTPIKMILPKGQDINYLYNNNQMRIIDKLL